MNKTININLGGIIFHLDENAYLVFNNYLKAVKSGLEHQESGAEIIADIEARIAEIFGMRLKEAKRQVINESDVEFIISTLGKPEDFSDNDDIENEPFTSKAKDKRFFRNPDEKVIGGVCSGIAAYFNTDVVWIRIIFLILFFFTGIGFFTYIILWAAIPEAKTTAQKLQMRGEPVTLESIEKVFDKFGAQSKESGKKIKSGLTGFFEFVTNTIGSIFSFIFRFLGVMIAIIGALIAFSLLIALLGIFGSTWSFTNFDFININGHILGMSGTEAIFGNGWRLIALRFGTVLTLLMPLFALVVFIAKVLGKEINNSRLLSFSGIASFIMGLLLIFVSAGSIVTDFKESATDTERNTLSGTHFDIKAEFLEENSGFFFEVDDEVLRIENIRFNIQPTSSNEASLELRHTVSGRSHSEARQRAQNYDFPFVQNEEELQLSEYFNVPKSAMWRAQNLKVTLYLPIGSSVYLDPSIENIMYDVKNLQNMWDGEMLGRTWTMTSKGLSCEDCPEIIYYRAEELEDEIQDNIDEELEALEEDIERKLEELELELKRLKDR